MRKKFIITIDTESDNQWSQLSTLSTENAKYIPRFQKLCEKYTFKPVYLTDFTMAQDDYYCGYMREKLQDNLCEIGMHLHAWSTPPFFPLDNKHINKPYLIEYETDAIRDKIKNITELLEGKFGTCPISHRAGRWALDNRYGNILEEIGYKIDCSVTPGVNWKKQIGEKSGGMDYTNFSVLPFFISKKEQLLEVPMTVRKIHRLPKFENKGLKSLIRAVLYNIIGKELWFRPSLCTEKEILFLLEKVSSESTDYIEFMMHSSEFMPGGSPYYKTQRDVDNLFDELERLFRQVAFRYDGMTLGEYYEKRDTFKKVHKIEANNLRH